LGRRAPLVLLRLALLAPKNRVFVYEPADFTRQFSGAGKPIPLFHLAKQTVSRSPVRSVASTMLLDLLKATAALKKLDVCVQQPSSSLDRAGH
jgi:hypothetical protein